MNDSNLTQRENSAVLWNQGSTGNSALLPITFDDTAANNNQTKVKDHPQRWAFVGICLFSILVTLRPQDFSQSLGDALPYAKIVAIITLVLYLGSKLQRGERPFIWPIEMKMAVLIGLLGALSILVAASAKDTFDVLTDPFLKVLIIFAIMINIVDSPKRLNILLNVVVACGAMVALYTIEAYFAGDFIKGRLVVLRDTLFGNS